MFQEDYEKLTRGEQRQFEDAVNDLLYTCFIVRKSFDRATNVSKISPTYLFIERHYNLINDFVGFIGLDLVKDDQNGVIYLNSEEGRNRIRIDSVTTLLVYALRSYYEEKVNFVHVGLNNGNKPAGRLWLKQKRGRFCFSRRWKYFDCMGLGPVI